MSTLSVRQLKKAYPDETGAIRSILDVEAFDLAKGEQAALEGGSGSGKTTFLNCIAGILEADSGEVEIAGQSMTRMSEANRDWVRACHIGYVFQTFNLLQGYSAIENVELAMMFAGKMDGAWARALLDRVGLGPRMHYRPRQLSVGQQQRVAVARALANRPELVLADEPTGNLDAANSREALALIREVCRESNAALLLVSHDPRVLEQFDRRESLTTLNRAATGAQQ